MNIIRYLSVFFILIISSIAYGQDLIDYAKDDEGSTALMRAEDERHVDIMEYLKKHGAK